jgi:hypothetical protein
MHVNATVCQVNNVMVAAQRSSKWLWGVGATEIFLAGTKCWDGM